MRADLMPVPARTPRLRWRLAAAGLATATALMLALPTPSAAQVPAAEDLRALLYYLDHDDQRSVQAEMRRLRAQFPQWTPPGDVNELRAMGRPTTETVDVQPIWDRIQRNDYAGARVLIEQAQARVPGWTPDAEMLRVLDGSESQQAFEAAYARRDLAAAVAAVRRTPTLMRCDRINNAWRLAELYQLASQTDSAVTTYRGVVQSCTRISDAVPTLEKANDVASWPQMEELFAVARAAAPTNGARLDELEERLRAGRGLRTTGGTRTAAAAATTTAAASAAAPRASAPAPAASAPAAVAAAPALPATRGPLPARGDGRIATVRRLKEQGNWPGCLAASANPRSLEVLYERSWCAYNLDRGGEALAGFTATAQGGAALGSTVVRDARFGMALAYLNLNMTEEGSRIAAATNLTTEQRREVEATILDQRGVRAYHRREYAQSIAYLTALEQLNGSLRRDLAMLRGYAYLNNEQYRESLAEFTRLDGELSTAETRSAMQSLRNIMSGL